MDLEEKSGGRMAKYTIHNVSDGSRIGDGRSIVTNIYEMRLCEIRATCETFSPVGVKNSNYGLSTRG